MHPLAYLHYHIIDTGEHGDFVFVEGNNVIDGVKRVFSQKKVFRGTVFYESGNVEPLEIERDLTKYKYYCDTKNYDTISRNDILQTLMILRAKELLMYLICIGIFVTLIGIVANYYFTNTLHTDIINSINQSISNIKPQITPNGVSVRP